MAAAGHFSWTRALAAMLACSALLGALYRGWARLGSSLPSATPPAWTATPAASPTSAVAEPQADLTLAEGEWTLDPRDPKYSESDRGTFYLHREGPELRGKGPEDSSFRLWAEGAGLVGEASESGGKTWKMKWEWTVPGRSVRLLLSDSQGANQEAVLIRPSDLPAASPTTTPDVTPAPIPVLYEVRGDLNGDGKPETVQVLGCDGQDRPDTDGHKQMRILSVDSETLFESETFQEPFHVDSDVYAQKTEERAGVHILSKGSGYPLIRLVFASASGNFVDFKFNGSRFVLAEIGD
ncbi:MAG: hypothetical protein U0931_24205 [Vulcanimicrobiota bacterium]